MLAVLRKLLELIRFSHTLFALPFALLAALLAWYAGSLEIPPRTWRWQEIVGILGCMALARSAAMAFNRLADRDIDGLNPRTAQRHLPAGTLSVATVASFAALCSLGFVALTAIFWPNPLPLICSVPVLLFVCAYSYTKRFTALAHFWLGVSLMCAPVAAWIAIRGEVVWNHPADAITPMVLGFAVLFWVAGFDIIYACQDAEFDRRQRLHSVPAKLGVPNALRLAALCHAIMVGCLLLLPVVFPHLGTIYWIGIAAVAILLTYEHWLVRPDDLSRVNLAFFHVNSIISVGLFLLVAADLYFLR